MMPPKPPRKSYAIKSTVTSTHDVPQPTYEDPDAPKPAITDESQPEVKVKPVPRPRSKLPPKAGSNTNNNTVVAVEKTNNNTDAVGSQVNEHPADYERPIPVRPPCRPPISKYMTSSKPTATVDGGSHYMNVNTETVKPPAVNTEKCPPPPRPPLPSIYYDRLQSTKRPTSEVYTDESEQFRCSPTSSMRRTPVTPASSEKVVNLYGTYGSMATDRPAVPPRLGQPSLPCSASECETSQPQTRPPKPSFKPPPLPSVETPSESLYSEIEYRPYLDILPEDDVDMMTHERSTVRIGQYQSDCYPSHRQTKEDKEDISGMLRWFKRVSKSDSMALSLYGQSLEEEIRSFSQRAMNLKKALRLYNLLMMKRNETLRDLISELRAISNSLDKMQKKTKTISIAGGTTGAVGGVTAVLGIALAPVTMGTSLIATAVGAGMVASAGGIGAHTAKANKNIVNRMAVEKHLYDYQKNVSDLENCLDFIISEMNELRRHDIARLQRAGTHTDALKMAHLSQFVIRNYMNNDMATVAHTGGMSSVKLLQAFMKEMDQYFTEKNDQKLRESTKSKFSGRVRLLAENLQDELNHLNRMWEMCS